MTITNLSQITHVRDVFNEQVGDHALLQPVFVSSTTPDGLDVHIATPADVDVMDDHLINGLILDKNPALWMIKPEDMEVFLQRLPEDQRNKFLDMLHKGHNDPLSFQQNGGDEAQMEPAYYIWRWETTAPDGSISVHYYPLSQTLAPTERCEMAAYSCELLAQLEGGGEAGSRPVESATSGLQPLDDRINNATVQHIQLQGGGEADVISVATIPQEFVQMYDAGFHQVYGQDGKKYWERVEQ